jgi:uncharacterized phage protein gp47/JayE
MITFEQLLTPLDAESAFETMLRFFELADYPVDAWGEFDEPRATLQAESEVFADVSGLIVDIAASGVLAKATGDGLEFLADDFYDEQKKQPIVTIGSVTLGDTTGSGQSFGDGELIFNSEIEPDLIFHNVGAVTVPPSTTVPVTIQAEKPGAEYVISSLQMQLATPVPGLTVSFASDWITQAGADLESNASLKRRCTLKWGTVPSDGTQDEDGTGGAHVTGGEDAYEKWALDSSSEINRARVQEMPNADATLGEPAALVWIATTAGGATPTALAAASFYIQRRRPLGVIVSVTSANPYSVEVRGSYDVKAAFADAAKAYIADKLKAYFEGSQVTIGDETLDLLDIGERVYVDNVLKIIQGAPGVKNVVLTQSSGVAYQVGDIMPVPGVSPAADDVAKLVTSDVLLVQNKV